MKIHIRQIQKQKNNQYTFRSYNSFSPSFNTFQQLFPIYRMMHMQKDEEKKEKKRRRECHTEALRNTSIIVVGHDNNCNSKPLLSTNCNSKPLLSAN